MRKRIYTLALLQVNRGRKRGKQLSAFVLCLLQKGTKGLGCKVIKFSTKMSTFRKVIKLRQVGLKKNVLSGITFKFLHTKTSIGSAMVSQVYTFLAHM